MIDGDKTTYDSTQTFFEATGSREAFKSNLFMELMLEISTKTSFRDGTEFINRMRRTDDGIIETTFRNNVERTGLSIQQYIEEKTTSAIEEKGLEVDGKDTVIWKDTGEKATKEDFVSTTTDAFIDAETVQAAAKKLKLEEGSYNPSDYELNSVSISADEVGVKRQTENRPKEEGKKQPKRVENTVIHIELTNETDDPKVSSSSSYVLNSATVSSAFKLLFGFLCINELLGSTMVFFVDGAKNLNTTIANMFSFLQIKIILDWYHLRKKMEETMSLICNNTAYRNEMLQKIMPELWRGNVTKALTIIKSIDMSMVKNITSFNYLIGYLERVRINIPNYMLRAELGLRNSSNRGEKSNDLLVANRQKHNGMSWSDGGSTALASVSAIQYNNELDNWVKNGTLSLKLVERKTPKRPRRNRKRTDTAYANASAKPKKVKAVAA